MGGSLSIADTLAVLYGGVMRYDPKTSSGRNGQMVLQGPCGPCRLRGAGLKDLPHEDIKPSTSPAPTSPVTATAKDPGVDMTTGSWVRACQPGGRHAGRQAEGPGQQDVPDCGGRRAEQGQPWESFMFMAAQEMDHLTVFIDRNKEEVDGSWMTSHPQDFKQKFEAWLSHPAGER